MLPPDVATLMDATNLEQDDVREILKSLNEQGWFLVYRSKLDEREDYSPAQVQVEIDGNWWTSKFYRLLQSSDRKHFERLRVAFPQEVREFEAWMRSPHND